MDGWMHTPMMDGWMGWDGMDTVLRSRVDFFVSFVFIFFLTHWNNKKKNKKKKKMQV